MRPGDHLFNRLHAPEQIFVVQRQEGNISAFQHLLIHLPGLFFAGPQARTIVVVENHFPAVGAAFSQQRQQFVAAGWAQDREADTAQVEIIKGRQLFADSR